MKRLLTILTVALFLQSCVDPDTSAPVLNLISVTPEIGQGTVCGTVDENVIALSSTDTLTVVFSLTDDEELSQYKIDLHSNFDCHGHAKPLSDTEDWFVIDIVDVAGTNQEIEAEFIVPENVTSGTYHFSVQATDAVGNSSESSIYSLNVVNTTDTEAPILSISNPSESSFSIEKGAILLFEGTLTDNELLNAGGNGLIEIRYWSTNNLTINTLEELSLSNIASDTYDFGIITEVPITTVSGSYIFEVRAFDGVNNPSNTVEYNVEVL